MRRIIAAVAVAGMLAAAGDARAQDARAAARDVIKKWQEAVVNVRVVLEDAHVDGRARDAVRGRLRRRGRHGDRSIRADGHVARLAQPRRDDEQDRRGERRRRREPRRDLERADRPEDPACPTAANCLPRSCCATRISTSRSSVRPRSHRRRSSQSTWRSPRNPPFWSEVVVLSRLGRVGGWAASARWPTSAR